MQILAGAMLGRAVSSRTTSGCRPGGCRQMTLLDRELGGCFSGWRCRQWLCLALASRIRETVPFCTPLGIHRGDVNPGGARGLQPGICRLSSRCPEVFASLFHLSRHRCCDLPANTFGKGAGPHPRARISAFSAHPLPLESLCWCPTPMQSLGVAGAWINQALEGGQGCLHKSRRSLQMLTPCEI